MRITSNVLSICMLAALPFTAQAGERCEHSAPRDSVLNLSGVKTVIFDIGPHVLSVTGGNTSSGSIRGKACASDAKRLAGLVVTQQRQGDKLIVRAERKGLFNKSDWLGKHYGYLTLAATLPDNLAVQVRLGSGNVVVNGVATLSADVGSGDLEVRHVHGVFYADLGSGNIHASDIGGLHVVTVGSGDLSARDVRGASWVGEIDSGEITIADANGRVEIGSIGSGDARLSNIAGDVTVASIGSGDLQANGIDGDLVVDSLGSGSVGHRNVNGRVSIPKDD
ncbi:MAG: hypothetical protein ABL934_11780 [Lysobacteraceae bacterium]